MKQSFFATNKEIQHPELGLVTLKKNPRSKRITLRVKNDGAIVVTLPKYSSFKAAEKIVHQNLDWVKTQLSKVSKIQATKLLSFDSQFQIRDKTLLIVPTNKSSAYLKFLENDIEIQIPTTWDIKNTDTQTCIQDALVKALRIEGKKYLPERCRVLAQQKGIPINDIRIKKVKTRWGSCSSKGNINLSLFLMLLPDELIDYVICHELAHIKHQNHSPAFWKHLENLLPGAKVLDKQINQYKHPF